MVATRGTARKRGAEPTPPAEVPASITKKRQRRDQPSSGNAPSPAVPSDSPLRSPPKAAAALPKGKRGMALLAAAGVAAPAVAQSPAKATPSPLPAKSEATAAAEAPRQVQRRASPRRDALLRQALPKSYTALADFFSALQLNYGTLRKRGQRCTYQTLRPAVEEQTGRRFLVSHLAQLAFLLPDVFSLEWVRLPVAPHSSRTEPHLAISLGGMPEQWDRPGAPAQGLGERQQPAGTEAAAAAARIPQATADADVGMLRQLLHYRLAAHLLAAYRQHLQLRAEELRAKGEQEAATELLAQAAAIPAAPAAPGSPSSSGRQAPQPVAHFAAGFFDVAPEVPQQLLPRRPDQPASAAASPAALSSHLPQPATPATAAGPEATPATAHVTAGRPPLPPATLAKRQQRRLSYGLAAPAPAGAPAAAAAAAREAEAEDFAPEVPGSAPSARLPFKSTKASTPLDKLHAQIMEPSLGQGPVSFGGVPEDRELDPSEMEFNGRILSEEEARVWDSLPEAAKRLSMDGIMSFEAHMAVEATARQHRVGSSKEAQQARALRNALGMLPKTFMRVQRVFGGQGPNAIKLQQMVARLRATDETFSTAEVEQQLTLLAQHAPECCSLRPYGSCGTPAVWWDRRAERASNGGIYRRLKQVAEARHSLDGGEQPPAAAIAGQGCGNASCV